MGRNQFKIMGEVNAAISMIAFKKNALIVNYYVSFRKIKIEMHPRSYYKTEILEFSSISDLKKYSESL